MKNDTWWVVILPDNSIVGQLYCSRNSAWWVWRNEPGVIYKKMKLVPVKAKKKRKIISSHIRGKS